MIHSIEFKAMGCGMRAALDTVSKRGKQQLEQVPSWFEAWEQVLSRFKEDSELSALNRAAGKPVQVSEILWKVCEAGLAAEQASGGLVTPAVQDALSFAGYEQSFEQLSTQPIYNQARDNIKNELFSSIQRDAATRTICLPPEMHLDFGGVAKGWAAHQAAERLKVYGSVLMEAGGDIAISNLKSVGEPWFVAVADPFKPEEELEMLMLGRCGVATSGKDYRRWQQEGVWKHHIIDPRTNLPAETDVLAATVVAPTVLEAEVAAKVVFISGSQAGLVWLENHKNLAGMLVLDNGQRLYNQKIEKYLWR